MLGEGSLVTCWNWQPAAFLLSCKQQGQEDSVMGVWIPNTLVLVSARLWHFSILSLWDGAKEKGANRMSSVSLHLWGYIFLAFSSLPPYPQSFSGVAENPLTCHDWQEGTEPSCLLIPRASLKLQRILWHVMIDGRAQGPGAERSSLSCARLSQGLSEWP